MKKLKILLTRCDLPGRSIDVSKTVPPKIDAGTKQNLISNISKEITEKTEENDINVRKVRRKLFVREEEGEEEGEEAGEESIITSQPLIAQKQIPSTSSTSDLIQESSNSQFEEQTISSPSQEAIETSIFFSVISFFTNSDVELKILKPLHRGVYSGVLFVGSRLTRFLMGYVKKSSVSRDHVCGKYYTFCQPNFLLTMPIYA